MSVAGACHAAPAIATPAGRLYVTNENSGDLTVIDTATRQVVSTIPLGKRPRGIKVSPDGSTLYIALSGSPMAPPGTDESKLPPPDRKRRRHRRVRRQARQVTARDSRRHRIRSRPRSLRTAARLFVANEDAGQASVIDVSDGRVIATVTVGGEPEGVDLRPDGKVVYVTSEEDNQVAVIDAATSKLITTFKAGPRPRSTGFPSRQQPRLHQRRKRRRRSWSRMRRHTNRCTTIKLEGGDLVRPMGVVSSADGKQVFVTTGRGKSVVVIDTATNAPIASIEVGERPWGIAATTGWLVRVHGERTVE